MSRRNMQPNTITRLEYKGNFYVKKILEKNSRWVRNHLKNRIRNWKKSFPINNTVYQPYFPRYWVRTR